MQCHALSGFVRTKGIIEQLTKARNPSLTCTHLSWTSVHQPNMMVIPVLLAALSANLVNASRKLVNASHEFANASHQFVNASHKFVEASQGPLMHRSGLEAPVSYGGCGSRANHGQWSTAQ